MRDYMYATAAILTAVGIITGMMLVIYATAFLVRATS